MTLGWRLTVSWFGDCGGLSAIPGLVWGCCSVAMGTGNSGAVVPGGGQPERMRRQTGETMAKAGPPVGPPATVRRRRDDQDTQEADQDSHPQG